MPHSIGEGVFHIKCPTKLDDTENQQEQKRQKQVGQWRDDIKRYDTEPETQEGRQELMARPVLQKAIEDHFRSDGVEVRFSRFDDTGGLYNRLYLERGKLSVEIMGRGYAWLDTGTHDSLHDASSFIETIEKRQGLKIACPEEIAFRMGYIDADAVAALAHPLRTTGYGQYLLKMLAQPRAWPPGALEPR